MLSHSMGTRCLQLTRRLALPLALLVLAGCSGHMAYRDAQSLAEKDQVEAALVKYRQAMAADPANPVYKAAYLDARDRNTLRLLEQGDRALASNQAQAALQSYQRAQSIDPANERARSGLRAIEADARHARLMEEANAAFVRKDYEVARINTAAILTERPGHEPARLLMQRVTDAQSAPVSDGGLAAAFKQPITIEFREAPLKQVFEVISRRSGLNFLFDKDVKTDQKTSIFLKNSTIEAAVNSLLMTNQLEQSVMDGNTILIYPNVPAKHKEYQELTIKTFFLANADAKVVANTIRGILKSRDVVVDEKLNLVIMRDSPEAIKLATKLVALQDVPEAEVMLEVEILEIKRSRLIELGINWPDSVALTPLTAERVPLTIDTLRGLNRGNIGVSSLTATVSANKNDGDSRTLANPRIRVRNKEKAKVVIGDKIPNVTTTFSTGATAFTSESVTYIDVGLLLNVEPTIYLNNEIAIRVDLKVSNVVGTTTTPNGATAYQIGTREATTMLQLKDGENQVLAGLINNEDRTSGNRVPGLGDLPIVGRLFGTQSDGSDKTEIVLSITPRLIRTVQRPAASASEFSAGTENSFRRRPDTAPRPATALPPAPGARPVAPAAPASAPVVQPAAPVLQPAPGAVVTPIPSSGPPPAPPSAPPPSQQPPGSPPVKN